MPRLRKGPRLFLRGGTGRKPTWVIRDGAGFYSTGFGEAERDQAEAVLASYCGARGRPPGQAAVRIAPRPGTLYFISCDHPGFPIKIGIAYDLDARVRGMQTSLPYKVVVLCSCPGDVTQERFLHQLFAGYRLEGEWFQRSDTILDHIKEIRIAKGRAKAGRELRHAY